MQRLLLAWCGVVQLGAVGTNTPARSKKNLGGGQHAECRRNEIDPKNLPAHGMKSSWLSFRLCTECVDEKTLVR